MCKRDNFPEFSGEDNEMFVPKKMLQKVLLLALLIWKGDYQYTYYVGLHTHAHTHTHKPPC